MSLEKWSVKETSGSNSSFICGLFARASENSRHFHAARAGKLIMHAPALFLDRVRAQPYLPVSRDTSLIISFQPQVHWNFSISLMRPGPASRPIVPFRLRACIYILGAGIRAAVVGGRLLPSLGRNSDISLCERRSTLPFSAFPSGDENERDQPFPRAARGQERACVCPTRAV